MTPEFLPTQPRVELNMTLSISRKRYRNRSFNSNISNLLYKNEERALGKSDII